MVTLIVRALHGSGVGVEAFEALGDYGVTEIDFRADFEERFLVYVQDWHFFRLLDERNRFNELAFLYNYIHNK